MMIVRPLGQSLLQASSRATRARRAAAADHRPCLQMPLGRCGRHLCSSCSMPTLRQRRHLCSPLKQGCTSEPRRRHRRCPPPHRTHHTPSTTALSHLPHSYHLVATFTAAQDGPEGTTPTAAHHEGGHAQRRQLQRSDDDVPAQPLHAASGEPTPGPGLLLLWGCLGLWRASWHPRSDRRDCSNRLHAPGQGLRRRLLPLAAACRHLLPPTGHRPCTSRCVLQDTTTSPAYTGESSGLSTEDARLQASGWASLHCARLTVPPKDTALPSPSHLYPLCCCSGYYPSTRASTPRPWRRPRRNRPPAARQQQLAASRRRRRQQQQLAARRRSDALRYIPRFPCFPFVDTLDSLAQNCLTVCLLHVTHSQRAD